jgi:hypothetical protein
LTLNCLSVSVDSTKKFNEDYFEVSVQIEGSCFSSYEDAQRANDLVRSTMTDKVLVDYQGDEKREDKGLTRSEPMSISKEGYALIDTATLVSGRFLSRSSCLSANGEYVELKRNDKSRIWNFSSSYSIKDSKEALTARLKTIKEVIDFENVKVTSSKVQSRYLVAKEKGVNRIELLGNIDSSKVDATVCKAAEKLKGQVYSATIIGCELTDQAGERGIQRGRVFAKSAGVLESAGDAPSSASINTANELRLQKVQSSTTFKVEVFSREINLNKY